MTSATLPAARWWLATLLFGVAVLVAGSTLGFPQTSHSADPGYGAPVLAFEFARGQDDLVAVANVAIGLALAQIGHWGLLFGSLVIAAAVPTVMGLVAPENFGWTLVAAIGGGWIALLATAAIACWQAVVRKRPVADFG